jgi:hypothetical protein
MMVEFGNKGKFSSMHHWKIDFKTYAKMMTPISQSPTTY